jgi:hypothetical protein
MLKRILGLHSEKKERKNEKREREREKRTSVILGEKGLPLLKNK